MARRLAYVFLSPLFLLCAGCSTVIEGRSQQIAIDTSPEGATCAIKSNDDVLGVVPATPGSVTIAKNKNDVLVECSKEGYETAKQKNLSEAAITSIGNMAMMQFSFVGNMVDSVSGAANKYDSRVFMTLTKAASVPQFMPPMMGPAVQPAYPLPPQAAREDYQNASPDQQLAQSIAQALASHNAVVVQKSPQEVAQMLASGQPIAADGSVQSATYQYAAPPVTAAAQTQFSSINQ